MPRVKWITVALGLSLLMAPLSGCDDDETVGQTTAGGAGGTGAEGGAGGAGGAGGEGPTPVCTEPTDVPCSDQVLLEMNLLQTEVAPGGFTNTPEGVQVERPATSDPLEAPAELEVPLGVRRVEEARVEGKRAV